MNVELLTFELEGVTLAVALGAVREIRPAKPGDVDLSEALGLGCAARSDEARTLVVDGADLVRLCVGSRPALVTVDSASVVDVPRLVLAHPAIRSIVLQDDRVMVLLDPASISGEAA